MKFKILDVSTDVRMNCLSVMAKTSVEDYLNSVERIYKNNGGIEGQRSSLKTKSAQRIRKRLVEDICKGSIIPPIVLGLQSTKFGEDGFISNIDENVRLFFESGSEISLSIIDGMQRTTALYEASSINEDVKKYDVRLEFWIANSTNSLLYRMLVLNTGQIPWSIKRQVEVVFNQLRAEIENKVENLTIYSSSDSKSRANAGEYQANDFIELFLLFGTKRLSIDLKEQLADEFARLDMTDSSGNSKFLEYFCGVAQLLVKLDFLFSNLKASNSEFQLQRFKNGKLIFSSQPARVGFMIAAAQIIFGIPGLELSEETQKEKYTLLFQSTNNSIDKLMDLDEANLEEIIDLPTLDESINIKASKQGDFERLFYLKSFNTFFERSMQGESINFTACWRSYQ